MIGLSVIYVNGEIRNIYVNTGYYAEKVAKEIKGDTNMDVVVMEYRGNSTNKDLINFIDSNFEINNVIEIE